VDGVRPLTLPEIVVETFPLTLVGDTTTVVPPPPSTSALTSEYRIETAVVWKFRAFTVPFSVAAVVVIPVAGSVVTTGATGGAAVVNDSVAPLAVPPALVAEALK
jgi:hypothetical protein